MIEQLAELKNKGVSIGLDKSGENLRITGKVSSLTTQEKQFLKANKSSILSFLLEQKATNLTIEKSTREEIPIQLNSNQKSIWAQMKIEGDWTMYWLPMSYDLSNYSISDNDLITGLEQLVDQHEILSYEFFEKDGEIFQQKCKLEIQNHVTFHEFADEKLFDEKLSQWEKEEHIVMDQPLWKLQSVRSVNKHFLLLNVHHLIADGASLQLFISELEKAIRAQRSNQRYLNDGIQYRDVIKWQENKQTFTRSSKFWKEYLLNYEDSFQLPDALDLNTVSEESNSCEYTMDASIEKKASTFIQEMSLMHTHLYTFALGFVLAKHARTNDLVVGIPAESRSHYQLEKVLGNMVNVLPLRLGFKGGEGTINDGLNAVKQSYLGVLEHQLYPFEFILEDIDYKRSGNRLPLVNAMLSFPNNLEFGERKQGDSGLETTHSIYDLSCIVTQFKDQTVLTFEYNSKRFTKSLMQQIGKQVECVIKQVINNATAKLNTLLLSDDLFEVQTETAEDNDLPESLNELLENTFRTCSDKTAIIDDTAQTSYDQLKEHSDQIAAFLQDKGVKVGDRIATELPYSTALIATMIGIWKVGGAYVPIGTEQPIERKKEIIEDCQPSLVMNANMLSDASEFVINEPVSQFASNAAYILYTSGSTGKPKGVVISHKNIVSKLLEEKSLLNNEVLTSLTLTSQLFDVSMLEMVLPLITGGIVVIASESKEPEEVVATCLKHQVSILQGTPTYMTYFESELSEEKGAQLTKTLKYICIGGESLNAVLVQNLKQKLPNTQLNNHYGPTETTIDALVKEDIGSFDENSIGKPVGKRTNVYVLDESDNPLPVGVIGELFIGGEGVGLGYINDEARTNEKFRHVSTVHQRLYATGDLVRWNAQGEIVFVGRKDTQVKINGYRIELDEISNRILAQEGVSGAHAAVAKGMLVSWFVGERDKETIKSELRKSLPEYMIPGALFAVDEIPLKVNGKVDEKQLIQSQQIEHEFVSPRTVTEEIVVEVWKSVLNTEIVSVFDNFFELGGHSLTMIKLQNVYQEKFHKKINIKQLFNQYTPEAHARLIDSTAKGEYETIVPAPKMENYPLSDGQLRIWILSQLEESSITYNMPFSEKLDDEVDIDQFEKAIFKTVEHYEVLRTQFVTDENGEPRQQILAVEGLKFEVLRHEKMDKAEMDTLQEKDAETAFDLTQGPLIRAALFNVDNSWVFYCNIHHIICDAVSMDRLYDTIGKYYESFVNETYPPEKLRIHYKDYSVWQQEQINKEGTSLDASFWKRKLQHVVSRVDLPGNKMRPDQRSFGGHEYGIYLGTQLSDSIDKYTNQQGVSLFIFFLTAMNSMLHRYSGANTITIGTSVDGRSHADLSDQIGFFINALPLRTHVDGEKSFEENIKSVGSEILEMFDHQAYPFDKMVNDFDKNRDQSRNPFFDMRLTVQNGNPLSNENQMLPFDMIDKGEGLVKLDLSLIVEDTGNSFVVYANYNTQIYDAHVIQNFLSDYARFIENGLANPKLLLKDHSYKDVRSEIEFKELIVDQQLFERYVGNNATDVDVRDRYGNKLSEGGRGYVYGNGNEISSLIATYTNQSIQLHETISSFRDGIEINATVLRSVLTDIEEVIDVWITHHPMDENELVLFIVAEDSKQALLKDQIDQKFPANRRPRYIAFLEKIPTNESGVVQQNKLNTIAKEIPLFNENKRLPETGMEIRVARIFTEILETESIGLEENFFEVGGNSIKASKILARVHKEFGLQLDIASVFLNPTVSYFVTEIEQSIKQNTPFDGKKVVKKVMI